VFLSPGGHWSLRVSAIVLALCTWLRPTPAAADVADYLGKAIVSVAIQSDGHTVTDPRVIDLVQTRAGAPLSMADVRESITHLFSLGQYEDVRVNAEHAGAGVALTYDLVPMHPITGIDFEGSASGIDHGQLRRLVTDRFGASPRPGRAAEVAAFVADDIRQAGYLRVRVTPRTDVSASNGRATLVFVIVPGDRSHIASVVVEGDAGIPESELIHRLALTKGAPFLRADVNTRIEKYIADERKRGFYEARLTLTTESTDDDRTVDVKVAVAPGPHVAVKFDGDPLPADRRDELVPIAREGSTDQDLLEDATNRIEEYLRTQGYRDATAQHARDETNGEMTITFTIKKGPLYRVGRMDVSGNASMSLTDLQSHLRVRPGQPFSTAAIDADVATIEDLYRRQGFAAMQADVSFESQPDVAAAVEVPVAIRLAITENVRTVVRTVRVEGLHAIPEAEVLSKLGLQPGTPFFVNQMAIDRDAVQLRLANLGYQSATVATTPGLSADGTSADVVFGVREGPQIFVEHVLIVGNERTRTETIERELLLKPGEPLGLERVNESQRRLAALGLFRRARITELAHGDESKRDILVTVEEAPVASVGYGGGFEVGQFLRTDAVTEVATERIEFAPRAFFEIGRRNLFGKNRSINLFTRVSLRNQFQTQVGDNFLEYRVVGTYREPKVFGTAADAALTGTIEQQARTSFDFARRGISAELARRLTRAVSVIGSYQIQRTELFNEPVDPATRFPIDRIFPQLRLSSFSGSVIRDTRDDLLDPTDGRFFSANSQIAARKIGSEVGFVKSYFTAQMFETVPHASRLVVATSARLGMATAFARTTIDTDQDGNPILGPGGVPIEVTVNDLPASERFFAGGDTTVRGFALDQLGRPETIDKDGFPTGGAGLVILNAELRAPVRGGFGVVGFVDSGNVFLRTSDIRLPLLRGAVGFGLRYKSPIGPIRVDLGFKLHRGDITPGKRESLTALHISLGQAF